MVKEDTAPHSQLPEVSLVLEDSMPSYDTLGHIVCMYKLKNTHTHIKNEINFIK